MLQTFVLSYTTAKPGKYLILYNCSFSILLQWCQSVIHTQVTNCSPLFSSDVHETGCVLSEYSNCKLFKWCFLIIFQDESRTMLTNVSTCGDVLPPTSSRQPPLGDLSPLSIHWNISSVHHRNGLRQSPGLSILQSSTIQGAATIGAGHSHYRQPRPWDVKPRGGWFSLREICAALCMIDTDKLRCMWPASCRLSPL